jgi:hypothetical protein
MTRYFFDIRTDGIFTKDHEGSEFASDAAAMLDASAMAREFAIDDLKQPEIIADRVIEVHDGTGRGVGTLRARDVVDAY